MINSVYEKVVYSGHTFAIGHSETFRTTGHIIGAVWYNGSSANGTLRRHLHTPIHSPKDDSWHDFPMFGLS